jgi:aryl-alcohol dehydrogenase-like predicted oxidoreductase
MQYRRLGTSDLRVSTLCLGTMTFGTQNSEAEAHRQLDFARDAGINFIDTAEMYSVPPTAESYGRTETIIGQWLKRQRREQIVLATKVAGPGRSLKWIRDGELNFDRRSLRAALDGSLRRLQTDYVDLYQLHWPARSTPLFGQYRFDMTQEAVGTPILETLQALAELVGEGKIRQIGVSNEWPWGVMEFVRLTGAHGLPRIVSIQNAYSLVNRTYELTLEEVCHREQVSLLAYSPLAFGHLSGKYLDDPQAKGRVTQFAGFGQRYNKPGLAPAVAAYVELARRHGLTPTQLALAFVCSRSFVASTIIGATTMVQLGENIDALSVRLTQALREGIERIHLLHSNPAP